MGTRESEIRSRTAAFGLSVIRLVESLPRSRTSDVIGKQLLRCGTSVGANYRAVCRAKSTADFVAKLAIVEEEADESIYWMDLLVKADIVKAESLAELRSEADQLVAIMVSSIRTAKGMNASVLPNPKSKV